MGLFVPFYLWGHQSTGLSGGRCSDGPRLALLSWEATNIGMASGTLEFYPISRVVAIGMGTHNSLGQDKHSRQVWLRGLSLWSV